MHCLEIYAWGSKEAVGVLLWAVRVVGVVRAREGAGWACIGSPQILLFRKCKQWVKLRWSSGRR